MGAQALLRHRSAKRCTITCRRAIAHRLLKRFERARRLKLGALATRFKVFRCPVIACNEEVTKWRSCLRGIQACMAPALAAHLSSGGWVGVFAARKAEHLKYIPLGIRVGSTGRGGPLFDSFDSRCSFVGLVAGGAFGDPPPATLQNHPPEVWGHVLDTALNMPSARSAASRGVTARQDGDQINLYAMWRESLPNTTAMGTHFTKQGLICNGLSW